MMFYAATIVLVASSLSAMVAHAATGVVVPVTFWFMTTATICCSVTTLLLQHLWLRNYKGWTALWLSVVALPCQIGGVAMHFRDYHFRDIYFKTFVSLITAVAVVVFMIRRTS